MAYKILGKRPIDLILNQLREKAPDLFELVSRSQREDGTTHLSQLLAQKIDAWLVAQEPPPKSESKAQAEWIERWVAGRKGVTLEPPQPAPDFQEQGRLGVQLVNLDTLRSKHPALYETVVSVIGYNSGIREVRVDNFHTTSQAKLAECSEAGLLPEIKVEPPVETPPVRFLDNGEPELDIYASVAQMFKASKTQLQDLSRRRAAAGWRGEVRSKPTGRIAGKF